MRFTIYGGLFALLLALAGCGQQSPPSVSDTRQKLEPYLAAKYGKMVDFRKINGEIPESSGMKRYTMNFRAAFRLGEGFEWAQEAMGGKGLRRKGEPWRDIGRWDIKRTPLPAGTVLVMKGYVSYKSTEEGWQIDEWHPDVVGYCTKLETEKCYRAALGS